MKIVVRPFFWPVKRRLLYDTDRAVKIHRMVVATGVRKGVWPQRYETFDERVETLFITHRGRFFLLIQTPRDAWLRPIWDYQARRWLFNYPPSQDTFEVLGILPRQLTHA